MHVRASRGAAKGARWHERGKATEPETCPLLNIVRAVLIGAEMPRLDRLRWPGVVARNPPSLLQVVAGIAVHDGVFDRHSANWRCQKPCKKVGSLLHLIVPVGLNHSAGSKPTNARIAQIGARRVGNNQIPRAPRTYCHANGAGINGGKSVLNKMLSSSVIRRHKVTRPRIVPKRTERTPDNAGAFADDEDVKCELHLVWH